MQQLNFWQEPIETVVIEPTRDMPLEVFLVCHRLAYYMELMERVDDSHVLWDEGVESIYSEELAEAEYIALQNDWFFSSMELPRVFVEERLIEAAH